MVGVVDIGTNSVRLLVTDGTTEAGRWVEVTGLGRGVDRNGVLSGEAIEETLAVLARFGTEMDSHGAERRVAIATSASRDASNREEFFDLAESALGVRPRLISGEEEARLAYAGATRGLDTDASIVVSDIGGGSTELVTSESGTSYEIGSIRITERVVPTRPAPASEVLAARELAADTFAGAPAAELLFGVAGTWTSLAAMARPGVWGSPPRYRGLAPYARERVHGYNLTMPELESLIERLAGMTLEQTAAIPSLNPKRALVILGGAIVAEAVMGATDADEATISEHDTLDGVAMELLALP